MNVALQPGVLRWARERAGLSIESLARKVGTRPEKVLEWEKSGQITLKQAEKLAQKTHAPFGYLYLYTPPTETLPVADFRTVGSESVAAPSPELIDTLDHALERQDWFREYAIASGLPRFDFVGWLTGDEDIVTAARYVRERFVLDTASRSQARRWEEALILQCESIENQGVLIMRNGIVGDNTHRSLRIEEFRGFALADVYAPLLFINSNDYKAAQMFTVMHELVHLCLGASGVFNLEETYAPPQPIEQFCNAVAAEILVPSDELRAQFAGAADVSNLTRHFKVSQLVIFRRLRDISLISKQEFTRRYAEAESRMVKESETSSSGGGDYYRNKVSKLGRRFTRALLESALEGRTSPVEAFRLLGVRNSEKMRNLAKELQFDIR